MNEKIPKVIHYVWLGGNRLNKTSQKCLNSWSAFLPEYKIVKWDERNALDIINAHVFARQAYECKKYAFVSDYLRLFLLYYYGGIYMDTDVEVTKPLDEFLGCGAFSSEYPTKALRPLNSRMSKRDLDRQRFKKLPTWQNALKRYLVALAEL